MMVEIFRTKRKRKKEKGKSNGDEHKGAEFCNPAGLSGNQKLQQMKMTIFNAIHLFDFTSKVCL